MWGRYEIGIEFFGDGHDDVVECGEVLWISDPVVWL
jgi:hypothetical protein